MGAILSGIHGILDKIWFALPYFLAMYTLFLWFKNFLNNKMLQPTNSKVKVPFKKIFGKTCADTLKEMWGHVKFILGGMATLGVQAAERQKKIEDESKSKSSAKTEGGVKNQ